MDASKIVERIEARLIQLGKSKADFYRECGVSSASMSQWRTGQYATRQKALEKIADYLDVSSEWLLTGDEDKKEKPLLNKEELSLARKELMFLFDHLPPEKQKIALEKIKSLLFD